MKYCCCCCYCYYCYYFNYYHQCIGSSSHRSWKTLRKKLVQKCWCLWSVAETEENRGQENNQLLKVQNYELLSCVTPCQPV